MHNGTIRARPRSTSCKLAHKTSPDMSQCVLEWILTLVGFLEACSDKCLLKVVNNIFNILNPCGNTNQIRCHAALDLLLVGELLMRGHPRVDDESLRIAHIGEVGTQAEIVDYGADLVDIASLGTYISPCSVCGDNKGGGEPTTPKVNTPP